jgi:hypothetical protein
MIIAMWSGPRNLSTAMMYSFAARGDCAVWDEPFYAAYLKATGIPHPMASEIIAHHDSNPDSLVRKCTENPPSGLSLCYQKHMPLHMLPEFPLGFMAQMTNVFLIRHPARVTASYAQKRENPTLSDLGFIQQARLFDREAQRLGRPPLVIDSADIRANPRAMLTALCAALGIPFTDRMLSWPAGPKPYDGIWAPHWYGAIHRSTGFDGAEGPLPALPPAFQSLADQALPHYESLAAYRLRA